MSEDPRILVVEDDSTIRTVIGMLLTKAGYTQVTMAGRGDTGLEIAEREKPSLILLDVMLPGVDGFAIARRIRSNAALVETRILMLTARTEAEDIVRGLEAGADDYVTKPFDGKVLLARVRAQLRRVLPSEGPPLGFDGLLLDPKERLATLRGKPLDLTAGEFALLTRLVGHRGRILVRAADDRTIDVQVAKLRQKLGSWSGHIETIRGVGYRIEA